MDMQTYIKKYIAELANNGRSSDYVRISAARLSKCFSEDYGLHHLPNISDRAKLAKFVWLVRDIINTHTYNLSPKTKNEYRQTVLSFSAWCAKNGLLPENVFDSIPRDTSTSVRRQRRGLTLAEQSRLLEVVNDNLMSKAVYMVALHTGLRRKQLQGLQCNSIDDLIPSHVKKLLNRLPQNEVFKVPKPLEFYADCKRAVIPQKDNEGRIVDFESLHLTFGINLIRSGAKLPEVMQRMGQTSDKRLTQKLFDYSKIFVDNNKIEDYPLLKPANIWLTAICESYF